MDNGIKTMRMGAAAALAAGILAAAFYAMPILIEDDPAQYAGWARPAQPLMEPAAPMTLSEHVETLLPTLFYEDLPTRETGMKALAMALRGQGADLDEEARTETATALIDFYDEVGAESEEARALRKDALRTLIEDVRGDIARAFVDQVLEAGPDEMRVTAIEAMLTRGALQDKELSKRAYELAKTTAVPDALKPAVLRRNGGKDSEADLLALFQRDIKDPALRECAVELQNLHKPELMGTILARLEERGLLKDAKVMPWFSGKLLSEHISKAETEDLIPALKVVWLRPSLTRSTFKAVEERLAHADPMIRRMAARLVPDAVRYASIDPQTGEEILSARLQIETDPAVRGQIEGSLTRVRTTRRSPDPVPVEAAP